jgi:hypothetical protein
VSVRALIGLWVAVALLGLLFLLRPSQKATGGSTTRLSKPHLSLKTANTQTQPSSLEASESPATPSPRPALFAEHENHREIRQQDSYLQTREGEHQLRQQARMNPAYRHLPYRSDQVRIEIVNVTSDGRLVLKVIPLGLNVNPRDAYRGFLARYHDLGNSYLAQYSRYQP